jgi:predicted DNA-binding transcriptional regulator YafY
MKINRLLEITLILLNKKSVTAGELAERFGVSTRTIYRDIDELSSAGIRAVR